MKDFLSSIAVATLRKKHKIRGENGKFAGRNKTQDDFNKLRDKCKLLQWQIGGFILYYKGLEKGTFEIPRYDKNVKSLVLNYSQPVLPVDGISIGHTGRGKRYKKEEKSMV